MAKGSGLPDGVTRVSTDTFRPPDSLTRVSTDTFGFPDNVTRVSTDAFGLPDDVTRVLTSIFGNPDGEILRFHLFFLSCRATAPLLATDLAAG